MERKLILRGLLSGAVAAVLAFVFARIFVEPQIDKAIEYERGRHAAQEALNTAAGVTVAHEGGEVFSRGLQSTVGAGVGLVAFGLAIGGLVAVVYWLTYGRIGAVRARALAVLIALGGFLTVYLVPFLKYPANPPAVGHEETLGQRTTLYLTMVLASLVAGVLAVWAGHRLRARYSTWTAALLAGSGFVIVIGIVMLLLPALGELAAHQAQFGDQATETPQPLRDPSGGIVFPGFPADVLYLFRLYSVGTQLILWTTLGLCFGYLAERLLEPHAVSRQSSQKAASEPAR